MAKPSWGEWFEDARIKTKGLADRALIIGQAATKIAHEGAVELGKQAKELREKYELDAAASSILSTLGGAQENFRFRGGGGKKRSVLDVTYVTENLISMSFPYDYQKVARKPGVVGNDIDAISTFLQQKHGSHYMIWNISEETYDYTLFGDQVLEYNFPGHPAPPLGLLFKICTSVENWLDADEKNVAVVHCLTGKGRTSTVMSCILTWMGEFSTPVEALQYVAERRGVPVEYLTIPSQRRYVQYFTSMFGGLKPVSTPLLLRRVIMTRIPNYSKDPDMQGCCPYIQIFQNGQLVSTAAPRFPEREPQQDTGKGLELQWLSCIEGSASFTLDCPVQGDVLLRCRHAEPSGSRVSILRAAFHTGYITSGILRFEKADLDGACSDSRFHEDFFIDLIFAPLNPVTQEESKSLNFNMENTNSVNKSENENDNEKSCNEEEKKVETKEEWKEEMKEEMEIIEGIEGRSTPIPNTVPSIPLPTDRGLFLDSVSSVGFKDNSDKDFLFWEAVEARKNRSKKKRSRKFASSSVKGNFSISEDVVHSLDSDQGSSQFLKASSSGSSGVSNEEIIQQIDRLELEEKKEEGESKRELGGERKVSEGTSYDEEEEDEGEEGEFAGSALVQYDEDYGMSLGDVYPVEDDFLQVNVMSTNPSDMSNMISPMRRNTTPIKNTKKPEKSGDMDDFQFYINSMEEPTIVNKNDAQPSTPSAKTEFNGVVALDASAYKENPLRKHIQMSSEKTNVTPPVAASSKTDDNEELDELERYLLKLSTA